MDLEIRLSEFREITDYKTIALANDENGAILAKDCYIYIPSRKIALFDMLSLKNPKGTFEFSPIQKRLVDPKGTALAFDGRLIGYELDNMKVTFRETFEWLGIHRLNCHDAYIMRASEGEYTSKFCDMIEYPKYKDPLGSFVPRH